MLPTRPDDPTGQDSRVRSAHAEFRRRLRRCRDVYQGVLDRVEFVPVSNAKRVYEFRTLPSVLHRWLTDAATQVDAILLEGGFDNLWLLVGWVGPAYQAGAAKARATLATQSAIYKAAYPELRDLLLSEPYQKRLSLLAAREFEEMQGFAVDTSRQMARTLTQGMAAGKNPLAIARDLQADYADLAGYRAERIARTEINQAHNSARLDQADDARQRLGLDSREMHVSALSPTTRKTHMDRHATLHTTQEQRAWWQRDANSINCKCSTVTVLTDPQGVPLNPKLVERAKGQLG